MELKYTYMTEHLNKLRQVKDVVYRTPVQHTHCHHTTGDVNVDYSEELTLLENLELLVDSSPNDADLGREIRNLIKNNRL